MPASSMAAMRPAARSRSFGWSASSQAGAALPKAPVARRKDSVTKCSSSVIVLIRLFMSDEMSVGKRWFRLSLHPLLLVVVSVARGRETIGASPFLILEYFPDSPFHDENAARPH